MARTKPKKAEKRKAKKASRDHYAAFNEGREDEIGRATWEAGGVPRPPSPIEMSLLIDITINNHRMSLQHSNHHKT